MILISTNTPDQSQHLVDIWNLFKFDPKSQVHLEDVVCYPEVPLELQGCWCSSPTPPPWPQPTARLTSWWSFPASYSVSQAWSPRPSPFHNWSCMQPRSSCPPFLLLQLGHHCHHLSSIQLILPLLLIPLSYQDPICPLLHWAGGVLFHDHLLRKGEDEDSLLEEGYKWL